jgi:hypothetical protein
MSWKSGVLAVVCIVLLGGALVLTNRGPVQAAEQGANVGPKYTVVETQGHNLLVTDNATNMLYYYTIDKDKEIGSDLKLRGSIDLSQVGKPEIKIKKAAK